MTDTVTEFLLGCIVGLTGWFFGGVDGFMNVLIACTVVDYFSGLCVAYKEHRISSRIGFLGVLKKCVMFSLVGVANLVDKTFLGESNAVRTVVVLFYVGTEGISIMENAFALGVPFPKVLREKFLEFAEEEGKGGNTERRNAGNDDT